jgi:histidinol-phosphate aminotransferase
MPASPLVDLLRPELSEVSPYVPHPGEYAVRLDANEAPALLSARARARLAEEAAKVAWERYPDASSEALRAALAVRTGVSAAEVLVGVGSDELITMLLTAFSQPRERNQTPVVLTTTPTFVMYAMSAKVRAQRVLEVPLDSNWDLATSSLSAAIRVAEPSLLFLASPNNPTGNMMSGERLVQLIEAVPRSLVVLDEAYVDYADHDQLALYRRFENVAILRTLSKVGFAGLRVGWLVARPELIREIDKVRQPYNLSSLSQRLGTLAVTELAPEITALVSYVVRERARVTAALSELSTVEVTDSQANFLWVQTKRPAVEVFEGLKESGVLVRSFHARGGRLAHQLRITLGTSAENDAFLAAFRALV